MTLTLVIFLNALEDKFFNWAWVNFPTIVSCVFLMWLTWWARGRFIDYRNRFTRVELDCGRISTNQIALERRLVGIDGKLATLIIHLSATKKIDSNLFRSQSPLELTETGVKILEEMGGRSYIDKNLEGLMSQMEEQDFRSGLDVQNYCSVLLNEKTEDEALVPVKDYIFRTPLYRIDDITFIPLDITVAITIMGVYLRNRYFEKHPNLKASTKTKNP